MSRAATIVRAYGVTLASSAEDAATVTSAALPRETARALVGELMSAGIEASDAPDHEDRTRSWVYVTEGI